MKTRKVKKISLITGLIFIFIFAIFIGIIGISRGLGSIHPKLNYIAKPFVCPSQAMTYTQNETQIGSETYWSANWFCEDAEIASDVVFRYAGLLYGFVFFIILLFIIYAYWNSSIGPAQNDGLHLW